MRDSTTVNVWRAFKALGQTGSTYWYYAEAKVSTTTLRSQLSTSADNVTKAVTRDGVFWYFLFEHSPKFQTKINFCWQRCSCDKSCFQEMSSYTRLGNAPKSFSVFALLRTYTGGAYSAPPDLLTGGEGAGCPLPTS